MVEGIDKLKKNFETLGKELLKSAHPAMLEGGEMVATAARNLVPVASGKLRSTIRVSEVLKTRRGNDMVVVSAGDQTTVVGNGPFFQLARLVEFGTQKNPAEPFMRPAMRRHRRAITTRIRKTLSEAIKKG